MGKAKKRNFHTCIKNKNGKADLLSLTRKDAITNIITRIKNNDFSPETKDIIGLFGISAEELSEAGATYEELKALGTILR